RLADYIRLRDNTCTHPACNQPADKCDIDHVIPWPQGQTTTDNASTECRRHHRKKHETDWTIHRNNNTTTWTNPTGRQHHNTPTPLPTNTHDPPPF
ncbi:MAG: HNH endonuclease signature motif containing protein, partial [Thermocrispum sp.]